MKCNSGKSLKPYLTLHKRKQRNLSGMVLAITCRDCTYMASTVPNLYSRCLWPKTPIETLYPVHNTMQDSMLFRVLLYHVVCWSLNGKQFPVRRQPLFCKTKDVYSHKDSYKLCVEFIKLSRLECRFDKLGAYRPQKYFDFFLPFKRIYSDRK